MKKRDKKINKLIKISQDFLNHNNIYYFLNLLNRLNKSDKFQYGVNQINQKYELIEIKDNEIKNNYICDTKSQLFCILRYKLPINEPEIIKSIELSVIDSYSGELIKVYKSKDTKDIDYFFLKEKDN